MQLIDSHCHVDADAFDEDRAEVLQRAKETGIEALLVVGTGDASLVENFERVVRLANSHSDIFCSIGIHPHDAKTYSAEAETRLITIAESNHKVVGWGEIGLDYFYDHSPKNVQIEVFRRQIRIAQKLNLPIIIHSRDADEDTAKILTEECSGENFAGGVMHCFGGSPEFAAQMLKLGFYISFAGNITFKKAENLREAARLVPLERLLIETDAPYLAPVPKRGKRNEPAFVRFTGEFLADFYGIEPTKLASATTENFYKLFRRAVKIS